MGERSYPLFFLKLGIENCWNRYIHIPARIATSDYLDISRIFCLANCSDSNIYTCSHYIFCYISWTNFLWQSFSIWCSCFVHMKFLKSGETVMCSCVVSLAFSKDAILFVCFKQCEKWFSNSEPELSSTYAVPWINLFMLC